MLGRGSCRRRSPGALPHPATTATANTPFTQGTYSSSVAPARTRHLRFGDRATGENLQRGAQPPYPGFQLGDLFTLVLDRDIACRQLCPGASAHECRGALQAPSRRRSASFRATRRASDTPEARCGARIRRRTSSSPLRAASISPAERCGGLSVGSSPGPCSPIPTIGYALPVRVLWH